MKDDVKSLAKRAIEDMMKGKISSSKPYRITYSEVEKLVASPLGTTVRVIMTPDVARPILDKFNEKQSKIQRTSIEAYKTHMLNKNWVYDGNPIAFTDEPLLASGQHRLLACVESGCEFETALSFGHDPRMRYFRNSGKRDKPEDYLALDGWKNPKIVAGAMRWIFLHRESVGQHPGRSTWHPTFYPDLVRTLGKESLNHCVKVAKKIHGNVSQVPPQYVAAVYYIARSQDRLAADEFFENWANAMPCAQAKKAQIALQKIKDATGNKSGKDWDKFAVIICAWNKHYSGNSGKYLKIGSWNQDMPVPPIIGGDIE